MNRFAWFDGNLEQNETTIRRQNGVALYDGEAKTPFVGGELVLSTHRILWNGPENRRLSLRLNLIVLVEEQSGSWSKSSKIICHLGPPPSEKHTGVVQSSPFNYVRFSFRSGGESEFFRNMQTALQKKEWETMPIVDTRGKRIHAGIVGIERQMQAKREAADKHISAAFEDLTKLINMAKEMVSLSQSITQKLKEKGSNLTDDETITFKSHLLSLGISDPVTKSAYGSGSTYHRELAKQLAEVLVGPVQEAGGIIALTDVYCRVNRARGLELLSPEDLLNACKVMEHLNLPLRLKEFESGVTVLELAERNEVQMAKETRKLLDERESLSAEELSSLLQISVILARERLLSAERECLACRDDSVEGLRFYPNLFAEKD
ncbi:vacuolar protein-sorting-associated protein 36-like [Ornithodoros turicata]|uniref:vacuolar protein-sorting-associated protein 36-like n=1 Tax=Ornithodoros turicata TaxID=34597 RepID=UPI003138E9F9